MESKMNFKDLVRRTCMRILSRFLLAVFFLYLLPLVSVSGDGALNEKIVFFFLNLFSWLYMSILFLLIAAFQIGKMLRLIKREMDLVYENSVDSEVSVKKETLTLFEFAETDRRIRLMKAKIGEMLEKEKAGKEDLIFKVSAASHDLKTPLTVIQGNADLLLYSPLTEEQRQCVEDTAAAATRMRTYFDSLIAYSKTYYDDVSEKISVSLGEIAEAVREEVFFHVKEGEKVSFESRLCESDTGKLHLNYLLRAVSNLLDNAKEYADSSAFHVDVLLEKEEDMLVLSVGNRGSAFPLEMLKQGVRLFYKENAARTHTSSHYGIGLAFVKRVAELHEGALTLSNVNGLALAVLKLKIS